MLPIVKQEIIDGIMASVNSDGYSSTDIYDQILQENPVLFSIIEVVMVSEDLSEDFKAGYLRGAAQMYKLLATQMECDELE